MVQKCFKKYVYLFLLPFCILSVAPSVKAETVSSLICRAYYTHTVEANTSVTEEMELAVESESGGHLQQSVDFQGRNFSALYFKASDDLLLQIVQSADTTQGLVSRGRLDQSRSIALTEVKGATVYKLECKK